MPRLLLVDDDGREMFSGEVSRANVERVAEFLGRHMTTLQAMATVRRAVSVVVDAAGQVGALAPRRPPAPRPRRSRR